MQRYTEIPSSTTLEASLPLILNNDKTSLSCNAGTAFPTADLREGMLCFRIDQKKLYQLSDLVKTEWRVVADLSGDARNLDGGFGTTINYDKGNLDDWDAMPTGFYQGKNMHPVPPGDTEWRVMQIRGNGSDGYASQMAFGVNSGKTYSRFQRGGTWSKWNEVFAADTSAGGGSGGGAGGSNVGMNADMLDGYHAGHGHGQIPISDGTVNTNLNADKLDGYNAGNGNGQIPINNGVVNTGLNADQVDGYSPGNQSGGLAINNGKLNYNLNAEMVGGVKVENLLQISGAGGVDRQIENLTINNLGSTNATITNASINVATVPTLNATTINVQTLNDPVVHYSGSGEGGDSITVRHNSDETSTFRSNYGISAGDYTIKQALQKLITMSHTHSTGHTNCQCRCNCDSDGGCFVSGNILTSRGYIPIENLKIGDEILNAYTRKPEKVIGIASNTIGDRRAFRISGTAFITEDHVFMDEYDNPVIPKRIDSMASILNDPVRHVKGRYSIPLDTKEMIEPEFYKLPSGTKTYSPICKESFYGLLNGFPVLIANKI